MSYEDDVNVPQEVHMYMYLMLLFLSVLLIKDQSVVAYYSLEPRPLLTGLIRD